MLLSNPGFDANGSPLAPTFETLHITGGPSFDRICYRTRVFVPIHENEHDEKDW